MPDRIVKNYRKRFPSNIPDDNYYTIGGNVMPYSPAVSVQGTGSPGVVVFLYVNGVYQDQYTVAADGTWIGSCELVLGEVTILAENADTVYLANGYFKDNLTNKINCITSRLYTILEMYKDAFQDTVDALDDVFDDTYVKDASIANIYANFGSFFSLNKGARTNNDYRGLLRSLFKAKLLSGFVYGIVNAAWAFLGLDYNLNYTTADDGDGTLLLKEVFDSLTNMNTKRLAFFNPDNSGLNPFTINQLNPSPKGYGVCGDFQDIDDIYNWIVHVVEEDNDRIDWSELDAPGGSVIGTYFATISPGIYTLQAIAAKMQQEMNFNNSASNIIDACDFASNWNPENGVSIMPTLDSTNVKYGDYSVNIGKVAGVDEYLYYSNTFTTFDGTDDYVYLYVYIEDITELITAGAAIELYLTNASKVNWADIVKDISTLTNGWNRIGGKLDTDWSADGGFDITDVSFVEVVLYTDSGADTVALGNIKFGVMYRTTRNSFDFLIAYGGYTGCWLTPDDKYDCDGFLIPVDNHWNTSGSNIPAGAPLRFNFINPINSSDAFHLLWKTGANNKRSIGPLIGADTSQDSPESVPIFGVLQVIAAAFPTIQYPAIGYPRENSFVREVGSAVFYVYDFDGWFTIDATNDELFWTDSISGNSFTAKLTQGPYSMGELYAEIVRVVNETDSDANLTLVYNTIVGSGYFDSGRTKLANSGGGTLTFPITNSAYAEMNALFQLIGFIGDTDITVTSSDSYSQRAITVAGYFFDLNDQLSFYYLGALGAIALNIGRYPVVPTQVSVDYAFYGPTLVVYSDDITNGLAGLNTESGGLNVFGVSWDISDVNNPDVQLYVNGNKLDVIYLYPNGQGNYDPPDDDDLGSVLAVGNSVTRSAVVISLSDGTDASMIISKRGKLSVPSMCLIDEARFYNRVLTDAEHAVLARRPELTLGKNLNGWTLESSVNSYEVGDPYMHYVINPSNYPVPTDPDGIVLWGTKTRGGGIIIDVYNPNAIAGSKTDFERVMRNHFGPAYLHIMFRYNGANWELWE